MTKTKTKTPPRRKTNTSVERAADAYERLRPTVSTYTDKLRILLEDLMSKNNIKPQSMEHRTKTIESFREKIARPGKKYTDPIKQLTDLSGHRIIVYYSGDIERVAKIIQAEFSIDTEASLDKRNSLAPNEFGYLSRHYIVSLKPPRTSLSEWADYSNFKAEIQLRTVLQHAWAAIEHSLQYKTDIDIPSNSQRRLFRLSGLLEIADEEFTTLRDEQQRLALETRKALIQGSSKIEINSVTVSTYLDHADIPEELFRMALAADFSPPTDEDASDVKSSGEAYVSEIVSLAKKGAGSINSLDSILQSKKNSINAFFNALARTRKGSEWVVTKTFVSMLACCLVFRDRLTKEMLTDNGWDEDIAARVISIAKKQTL